VRRLARAATADELLVGQWTGRGSILDPYKPHLLQRWAQGCTVARRLFEELRERGYPGGESVVKRYVQQLREAFPHDDPPRKHPSVRDVTSWITRRPNRLDDDQAERAAGARTIPRFELSGVDTILAGQWGRMLTGLMFIGMPFHAFFGIAVMMSSTLIATFFAHPPTTWHLSPLADQNTGGGIVWAFSEIPNCSC
jgi:hypothetical protein